MTTLKRAEKRGQLRLVDMNRQTANNLTNIITGLESEITEAHQDDDDAR